MAIIAIVASSNYTEDRYHPLRLMCYLLLRLSPFKGWDYLDCEVEVAGLPPALPFPLYKIERSSLLMLTRYGRTLYGVNANLTFFSY